MKSFSKTPLGNLKPFEITYNNITEPGNYDQKNFKNFFSEENPYKAIDFLWNDNIESVEMIIPYSDEPNPLILAIFSTVVFTINRIALAYEDFPEYQKSDGFFNLIFLNIGKIYEEIKPLKDDFVAHHALLLPDQDLDTLRTMQSIRTKEVESLINNCLLNVAWRSKRVPRGLGRATFKDMSEFIKENINFKEEILKISDNPQIDTAIADMQLSDLRRKLLLKVNNPDQIPKISQYFNILYGLHILNKNPTSKKRHVMILPEIIKKSIEKILEDKYSIPSINKTVRNNMHDALITDLIWFNEIETSGEFPSFFNILSVHYNETDKKQYVNDELYYSCILDTLRCKIFMPYPSADANHFGKMTKDILDAKHKLDSLDALFYDAKSRDTYTVDIENAIQNGFLEQQKMLIDQFRLII